jgi:predicted TIM-barrel fold metal-dependent hydrolase
VSLVIDIHTHIWPDAIAARALGGAPADLERFGDGTRASLLEKMRQAGIDRSVCLGIAPSGASVEAANRFAGGLEEPLIGFGAIHPDLTPEENLASLRRNGVRGVKVHPVFQHFSLADRHVWRILEALADEFPVIAHVGHAGRGADSAGAAPSLIPALVRALPRLRLVACHFGGYQDLEAAENSVVGLPIHLDTSWPPGLAALDPGRVARLIERHGAHRICFASDWPMADPRAELEALERLPLAPEDIERIKGENFRHLLEGMP